MKLFKNYKWGVDMLGVLLFALLILPMIVYWCIPDFTGLDGQRTVAVFAYIFGAVGVLVMIVLRHKESKPFAYFTLSGTLTWPFLLLSYVAWIFYFCGFNNIAVALFVAVCPGVALVSFEFERKNLIAVPPTAIFVILRLVGVLILWV